MAFTLGAYLEEDVMPSRMVTVDLSGELITDDKAVIKRVMAQQ
jgi:hypothetical protein